MSNRASRRIPIAIIFILIFVSALVAFKPINNTDYLTNIEALHNVTRGIDPYFGHFLVIPPWAFILMLPISTQPLNVWLALTIALFVTMVIDLGSWSALWLMLSPAFLALVASSNVEWIMIGSGLWLSYRSGNRGYARGVAWLLLTCKPQTTFIFLIFDGIRAVHQRDWRAFAVSGTVAGICLAIWPGFLNNMGVFQMFSVSTVYYYGVPGALLATLFIVAVRWSRRSDWRTLGLLLAPLWTPYMLEYSLLASAFTVRRGGWLRIILYVVGSLAAAGRFWQQYHVAEPAGALAMVLLAAVLAPGITRRLDLSRLKLLLLPRSIPIWQAEARERLNPTP